MGIRPIGLGVSCRRPGGGVFVVKYVSFIISVQGVPVSHKQDVFLRDTQNAGCFYSFFKTNGCGTFPVAVCGIYQRNLRIASRKGEKQRGCGIDFVILVGNEQ